MQALYAVIQTEDAKRVMTIALDSLGDLPCIKGVSIINEYDNEVELSAVWENFVDQGHYIS